MMSFALTTDLIRRRTKTVTRRTGWMFLKPGTLLQPVVKAQGIKKGEHVEKIGGPIEVVRVHRERLDELTKDGVYGALEVEREGFSGQMSPRQFVDFFCATHGCTVRDRVTRIEFRYVVPDAEAGKQGLMSLELLTPADRSTASDYAMSIWHDVRAMAALVISYSREHRDRVAALVALLRACLPIDDAVFWDGDGGLKAGVPWFEQICRHIDEAEQLFVFWCFCASRSEAVRAELLYALQGKKIVVPVILDETPLSSELAPIHGVDLRAVFKHRPPRQGPPRSRGRRIARITAGISVLILAVLSPTAMYWYVDVTSAIHLPEVAEVRSAQPGPPMPVAVAPADDTDMLSGFDGAFPRFALFQDSGSGFARELFRFEQFLGVSMARGYFINDNLPTLTSFVAAAAPDNPGAYLKGPRMPEDPPFRRLSVLLDVPILFAWLIALLNVGDFRLRHRLALQFGEFFDGDMGRITGVSALES